MSALRYLAATVESDLISRLFDPSKPFLDPITGQLERDAIVDYALSLFRLNPSKIVASVFPSLVDASVNPIFHSISLDTLAAIAGGRNALAFHPTIDIVYETLSNSLRDMFQVCHC